MSAAVVHHGQRSDRRVALTFDDGPGPSTGDVLDILAEHGVRATFYLVGFQVVQRPEVARRIVAEGHEVGNHTFSHTRLGRRPLRAVRELTSTNRVVHRATGVTPSTFRAPWGDFNRSLALASAVSRLPAIAWDVDSLDWGEPGPEAIERNVAESATGGSIVLLHDGIGARPQTVAALPGILAEFAGRDLEPATVGDLLEPRSAAA
jgi:peptidoglycan/xylan/chitin deacetylase (PgdA/CDA1 family)